MNMAADLLFNSCIVSCFMYSFLVDLQIIVECIPVLCIEWTQNKNKLVKNMESSNYVITSSQNSNSFLKRFDRMHPWRPRRNFKPNKSQNSLVGTKAFIKDSWRQCVRLVKAFGTKLPNCYWYQFSRVLIFSVIEITVFRRYIFSRIRHRNAAKSQNCQEMTEFSKTAFFTGTNFRELCQKPQNPRKLIPIR